MRGRTWLPAKFKPPPRPKVPDDVRQALEIQAEPAVAALKQRFRKRPNSSPFNRPDDLYIRWHRDALYFVLVMRTSHGPPPTFETHVARIEHAGAGKFNLAVPMRRGWNTVLRQATSAECLKAVSDLVHF
jgi:hypothetical protein